MTATMTRRRLSVAEYEAMGEDGVLAPDLRTELLDGEVLEMSPIGHSHETLVARLDYKLQRLCDPNAFVRVQSSVVLDQWSMPQPDVALLAWRDDFYASARPTPADILLLIEVSDTSLRRDRGKKLALYAAADVPVVWIVNVKAHRILAFEGPVGSRYTKESEFGPGDTIAVPGATVPVPVADLIGEQARLPGSTRP